MSKGSPLFFFLAAAVAAILPGTNEAAAAERLVFLDKFGYPACPYCPVAREALADLEAELGPDAFAYVETHVAQGLVTPSGTARWQAHSSPATPTVYFDGLDPVTRGDDVLPIYRPRILARLQVEPPIEIEAVLELEEGGASGTVTIDVALVEGMSVANPEEYTVRAVLYEDGVIWCCGHGGRSMWDRVTREFLPGTPLELGAAPRQTLAIPFTVAPEWNAANLRAIAFVQRGAPGEVLNAARATLADPSPVDAASWGRVKALYRN